LTGTLETASSKDRRAHRFKPPFFFEIHLKSGAAAKEQSGAAAADRTPTPKSVTESPNTKRKLRTGTVQILSHSKLYNSQA